MDNHILEACVDSVESAINATNGGANRLELCGNLMIGGTTPTKAVFEEVRNSCNNIIHILIRPRFGDFCYTEHEFRIMLEEVKQFRELRADGVVIGMLRPDGVLDLEHLTELIHAAGSMSLTLHRAFDVCLNPFSGLEDAISLGFHTILTSGQKNTCIEGKDCLRSLIQQSDGRIDIMAGSGVDAAAIEQLLPFTGGTSYHMSGKIVLDSTMQFRKQEVHMGLDSISEYEIWQTSEEKIRKASGILFQL